MGYLQLPPLTSCALHPPFSLPLFIAIAILIGVTLTPFVRRVVKSRLRRTTHSKTTSLAIAGSPLSQPKAFPWWGWAAVLLTAISWLLAWTRFSWFSLLQPYTFPSLWVGYILTVNALARKETGRCLLTARPALFVLLFPVSSVFWWFFEYLNRFVQNWHYVGVEDFSPAQYVVFASLCFSTVLPAVSSTAELLSAFPILFSGLDDFLQLPKYHSSKAGWAMLGAAAAGLVCLPVFPNVTFPLLWLAPFMAAAGVRAIAGQPPIFSEIARGDWTRVARWALAAFICGFFWEMWNFLSLPKWKYAVPYLNRFHIFEMPLLGYAGYLPFGLECAVVMEAASALATNIERRLRSHNPVTERERLTA